MLLTIHETARILYKLKKADVQQNEGLPMKEDITVRRATKEDLKSIGETNSKVFLGDRSDEESALKWGMCWSGAFPLYQYFVIEVDGVFAGYAGWQVHGGFKRAEPCIELDQIGIYPKHQGKGLAPHLIRICKNELVVWMKEKNDRIESHITFIVWVYAFNANAISAYAKEFGDGIKGLREQFGDRAEVMLRGRTPIISPIRDE